MTTEQTGSSRDQALLDAVHVRIGKIQAIRATGHRHPEIDARLARLRRAVQAEAGTVPEVWADTVGSLPDGLRFGDQPSQWEHAIHESMTLYALHQQSKQSPMHRLEVSLGAAARKLVPVGDGDRANPIRTRFHALALAQSHAGVAHHLRALVTLLRAAEEPVDYGRLAVDLGQLQDPARAPSVRLRWGRAFSRVPLLVSDDQDSRSIHSAPIASEGK